MVRFVAVLAAALLCLAPVASQAALSSYLGTFEGMGVGESGVPNSLSNDGWLVYGNVYSGPTYLYGYGPFPAPNDGAAFSAVVADQGGAEQGLNQLSIYSDYNNQAAHTAGQLVEANVYHEQTVAAGDVGNTWSFQFDAKLGNLAPPTTAVAFIKTIDPNAGYTLTNLITVNTAAIPTTWNTYKIFIPVTADLVGQLMQFGFSSTATNNNPSGVIYDNLVWQLAGPTDVSDGPSANSFALRAPAPNPFRGATRVDYSLAAAGAVDLSVFDVKGRRVATLVQGQAGPGPHSATWDGLAADGRPVPSGVYLCVLTTEAGQQSRRLVLSR